MSVTATEIASQPAMWQRAVELLPSVRHKLPAAGERVAVIGCGTSYFIAQAVAHLRESAGLGETDALVASEARRARRYDRVIALSLARRTIEVVRTLAGLTPCTASLAVSA